MKFKKFTVEDIGVVHILKSYFLSLLFGFRLKIGIFSPQNIIATVLY